MNTAVSVIAYVPALHKGYLDFFKKHSSNKKSVLYLLDRDFVLDYPRMERDIRAVDSTEMQSMIATLNIFIEVKVLNKKNLKQESKNISQIIMPDEDISQDFAKKYLKNKKIKYISTFLRWDSHSAGKNNAPVNPDRKISTSTFDKEMMKKAYALTSKSPDWWRQIGGLTVKNKKILFTAYNRPLPSDQTHNIFGDPRSNYDYGIAFELSKFVHAEAGMISRAAKEGISLDGASMYVTTFPCPMCAKYIATSGVKKVYYSEGYSLLDAEDILKLNNIEIIQVKLK